MNSRRANFCFCVMLSVLLSLSSQGQVNPHARSNSEAVTQGFRGTLSGHRSASSHTASAHRLQKNILIPSTPGLGFLSATQIPAGGAATSSFPAVMGDFNGDGKEDVATIVNTNTHGSPVFQISAALSNGNGTFNTVLTTTPVSEMAPIFVGNVVTTDHSDIVMLHRTAPATIEVFKSNGDGTFTSLGTTAVTTNSAVWATLTDVNADGNLDVVVADGANPGNIWTLLGKGDGTFQSPTSVSFTGQLAANSPVVFADFGNGQLDFAAPAASNNQVEVYLNNGAGGYNPPVALTTSDGVYNSCFLTGGNLSGHATAADLVSANCSADTITVYVNAAGNGTFNQGVYYSTAGNGPSAVSIADVNGDGKNDIVSTDRQSDDVNVFLGNGDGTVQSPSVGYATGGSPYAPALVADFNGDSKNDVILPDDEFSFVLLEGYGDGTLRSAMNYYSQPTLLGGTPYGVAIATGDFNGDGIPDFVIGNTNNSPNPGGITVFLSNPDGSMQPGVTYAGAATAQLDYVAVADFDSDGKLDIAATDSVNGGVQIFTGDGHGAFTVGSIYATGTSAFTLGVIAGDFNGDGKPDIAVVDTYSGGTADVGVLINNGAGFNPVVKYTLSVLATEITAADLGNKNVDLIVPLYGTNATPGTAVAIFLGKGDGTFNAESDFVLGFNNPYAAAIGDLNGDGKPDMAVAIDDHTSGNQGIAVALGNGDGTFQTAALLPSTNQNSSLDLPLPAYVKMTKLNPAGHMDLVYTNSKFGTVGVMSGNGDGTFNSPAEYPAGRWAFGIALADVNGDGATDVVASGNAFDFSGVTVLLNNSGAATAISSSSNPSMAGLTVTFTATVTAKVHGVNQIPTGSANFFDGATQLGSGTLNSSGVATFSTGSLAITTHSITAQYSGDGNFLPSRSPVLNQVVTQASDSTVVTSSNPHSAVGQQVTYSATVTPVSGDSLSPSGTVIFYDGSVVLGSGTLNAGVATFSTSSLPLGSHSITAQYSGDTNFTESTSPVLNQVVGQASDTTVLTSSLNPAAPTQAVTLTASVTSSVSGDSLVPSGIVTFKDGTTTIGTGTLSSGKATVTTSSLATGSHSITAQYNGDTNFSGSTSATLTQVITGIPDYSLAANPLSQSVAAGSSAQFTITLTPTNGYNGTVTINCPTNLPTGVSCNTPLTITSGSATLIIKTSGPHAELVVPNGSPRHGELNLWASLNGLGIVGMVLAGGWKKRNRRRLSILLAIVALAMILAIVGCGGGSTPSGGGGGGGTPAGSYQVQVTATGTGGSNGGSTAPHPLNLNLNVT